MNDLKIIKSLNKKKNRSPENLCDNCARLGYCRLTLSKEEIEYLESKIKAADEKKAAKLKEQIKRAYVMDDLSIENLTPLRAGINSNIPYKKYLQPAYEAFHQKDYETALLNYKAVLAQSPMNKAALKGLAVALYFTRNYEGALNAMLDYSDQFNDGLFFEEIRFIVHLRNRIKDEEEYLSFNIADIENEFQNEVTVIDETKKSAKNNNIADSEKVLQMQLTI